MAKRRQEKGGKYRWREVYDLPNGKFDEAILVDWYHKCQPGGSGPLSMMRMVCALIEEIAELKGVSLSKIPQKTNADPE